MSWRRYLAIGIGMLLVPAGLSIAAQEALRPESAGSVQAVQDLNALHRGKAGVYVPMTVRHPNDQALLRTHPLIDAIILPIGWRDLEPAKGSYTFGPLLEQIAQLGAAGKGVVVAVAPYGQAPDDPYTPLWLYEQPDVRTMTFRGGGVARGQEVRVPALWDPEIVPRYVEPLAAAMAEALDGHPNVWYIMPGFGHIGNLTAQPSVDGARAFLEAGWTPEEWARYCRRVARSYQRHFTGTPLITHASGILLRDAAHDNYALVAHALLTEFGQHGVATIHYGLTADLYDMQALIGQLAGLLPAATQATMRLGLGDDWPLWVPEHRRGHGPTRDHNDAFFARALAYALGGVDGLPRLPTTVLYCQTPEALASHPDSATYVPAVAEALALARQRLTQRDQALFGTPAQ